MAYATHLLCPYTYGPTASVATIARLLVAARSTFQDVLAVGDSRFTSPSGKGIGTIVELNRASSAMFGGLGALPFATETGSGSGGAPPGTFPYNTNSNGQGTFGTVTAAGNYPFTLFPNWYWYGLPANNANGGFAHVVCPDLFYQDRNLLTSLGGKVFDKNKSAYVDAICANVGGNTTEGMKVDYTDATSATLNWSYASLGSQTTASLGLNSSTQVAKTTISFASADNSINDSANGLGSFVVGTVIRVGGATTNGANFCGRIVSVAAGKIVISGKTLVNEAAGATITITAFTAVKASSGPFTYNASNAYSMMNIRSDQASPTTFPGAAVAVAAARVRFETGGGLVFTPCAGGGFTYASFLSTSDTASQNSMLLADAVLRAVGPKMVVSLGGQNDAGSSVTAATVKTNLLALIDYVRGALGYNVPWVILNNPFNPGLTSVQQDLESTYVQSYTEICDARHDVIFVNMRRILEDSYGWNGTSSPTTDSSAANSMASPLAYVGEWASGVSYSVNDVVAINAVNGKWISCSGGSGTFTLNETISQPGTGATGIFLAESGGIVRVIQTSSANFTGAGGQIQNSGPTVTRATVTAVTNNANYNIGVGSGGYMNDPRFYWRCDSAHTSAWATRPGTISQTNGFSKWTPVFPYIDPTDPAHWHARGAKAFADALFAQFQQIVLSAASGGTVGSPLRGRGR